jgi:hypothetical protein
LYAHISVRRIIGLQNKKYNPKEEEIWDGQGNDREINGRRKR